MTQVKEVKSEHLQTPKKNEKSTNTNKKTQANAK